MSLAFSKILDDVAGLLLTFELRVVSDFELRFELGSKDLSVANCSLFVIF